MKAVWWVSCAEGVSVYLECRKRKTLFTTSQPSQPACSWNVKTLSSQWEQIKHATQWGLAVMLEEHNVLGTSSYLAFYRSTRSKWKITGMVWLCRGSFATIVPCDNGQETGSQEASALLVNQQTKVQMCSRYPEIKWYHILPPPLLSLWNVLVSQQEWLHENLN